MHVLVLGANSDIGYAVAKQFARDDKATIHLASRNISTLEKKKNDLVARYGVDVHNYAFDATDYDSHNEFYNSLEHEPDVIIVSFGYLGEQQTAQESFSEAMNIINSNYIGVVSILEIAAEKMTQTKSGTIIGISSVAGERGRQSNYIYGSAKSGMSTYLSGLRNRLHQHGVNVITVLPGFVKTKMTHGLDLPEKLTASPDKVAADIHKAYTKGKSRIYTLWIWRYIMMIIKMIPERIFIKLNL